VISKPHVDWFALAPSLSLLAATGLLLFAAVFVPRTSRKPVSALVAFAGFVASGIFAAYLMDRSPVPMAIVRDSMYRDRWGAFAQVLLAGSGAITFIDSASITDTSFEGPFAVYSVFPSPLIVIPHGREPTSLIVLTISSLIVSMTSTDPLRPVVR